MSRYLRVGDHPTIAACSSASSTRPASLAPGCECSPCFRVLGLARPAVLAAQWRRIEQEEAFPGHCVEVGDELGSRVVAGRLVRELMHLAFLQEREYMPYSTWLGTGFARLRCRPVLEPSLLGALAATAGQTAKAGSAPRTRRRPPCRIGRAVRTRVGQGVTLLVPLIQRRSRRPVRGRTHRGDNGPRGQATASVIGSTMHWAGRLHRCPERSRLGWSTA